MKVIVQSLPEMKLNNSSELISGSQKILSNVNHLVEILNIIHMLQPSATIIPIDYILQLQYSYYVSLTFCFQEIDMHVVQQ